MDFESITNLICNKLNLDALNVNQNVDVSDV